MKKNILFIIAFLMLGVATNYGQINRTLKTKIIDVLVQLPTKDLEHSDRLMEEIIGLDVKGIVQITDMLVPLGEGNDTKARYAIESVAIYSGGKVDKASRLMVEKALLKAIGKSSHQEVSSFLIERLKYCGGEASVVALSGYLTNEALYKSALLVLTTIGTDNSGKVILAAIYEVENQAQAAFAEALGEIKYQPAISKLTDLANGEDIKTTQKALAALANIASESSYETLVGAVQNAEYQQDDSGAVFAFIHYARRLSELGNKTLSDKVANDLLKNSKSDQQLYLRLAAVDILSRNSTQMTKLYLKEVRRSDAKYRGGILKLAASSMLDSDVEKWIKAFKKADNPSKAQIAIMLGRKADPAILSKVIQPALSSEDENVRIAGAKAVVLHQGEKAISFLLDALKSSGSAVEIDALKNALLRVTGTEQCEILAAELKMLNPAQQKVVVEIIGERKATKLYDDIVALTKSTNNEVKNAAYKALSRVSGPKNLDSLLNLLGSTSDIQNLAAVQSAVIGVVDQSDKDYSKTVLEAFKTIADKQKILPVLPVLNNKETLKSVVSLAKKGNTGEQKASLNALSNWRSSEVLPYMFELATTNGPLKSKAFSAYLKQALKLKNNNDQKLLLVRKLMPFAGNTNEKKAVIKAASGIKTFLSLVFASSYLDDDALRVAASNAVIRLALPTPGKEDALSGDVVRKAVEKSVNNITGQDSQYVKIDVKEFLEKMPAEKGFVSMFNGLDLSGWKGLVKNPIARSKMTKKQFEKAQKAANEQMMRDWYVKDGAICFKGEGYNNICSTEKYGDFEMLVDWKITNGGDSGIYLRGTPQVQIWDIARTNVGAQVGSGGLYNNQKHISKPLKVADNPVNEWNTFRIKMVGEHVTVYLNGELVTDQVVLENYWDRKQAIFVKEAIELQAHGEDLGFRNVFVREINAGTAGLSDEEKGAGFVSLFNGKDLDQWVGNKTDYIIEDDQLAVRPKRGGHGNLYSAKEYSDFNFRFEFQLTPGANNGLGIHTPLEGDAAYVGKELQILDNTADIYKNLEAYQYHGSVYGIIAAKRGYLQPVGEWNTEEVIVKGNQIKIILNGEVIVDGDYIKASENGTADKKKHPGLLRKKGHIAFLGHGSELQFRNIRIKELK